MSVPQSRLHHYVPRWYQKRFLPPGQSTLFYLNLKPETVTDGDIRFTRKALWFWDPARCFCIDDLYSIQLGKQSTDLVEKYLFGEVDKRGSQAVEFFNKHSNWREGAHRAFRDILRYIGAQRFRTPRGLDWIKKHFGAQDQNQTIAGMIRFLEAYATMWVEGVWEIVHATNSSTKFIISDDPVTFFNRRIFPGEDEYPGSDDFPRVGTRTIFPLSSDSCLIITHLQLVRNPWNNPLELRENARVYQETMFNLTDIQFGRELEENEVLRINHILKHGATKFIAAGIKDALYPERHLGRPDWAKLDSDWFLLPNPWKVGFTSRITVGYKDGTSFGMDEYGRRRWHPQFEDKKRRGQEFRTFENGRREWAKKRIGKSLAHIINQMREDSCGDRMMHRYLQEQGLVSSDEATLGTGEMVVSDIET